MTLGPLDSVKNTKRRLMRPTAFSSSLLNFGSPKEPGGRRMWYRDAGPGAALGSRGSQKMGLCEPTAACLHGGVSLRSD